MNALVCAAQPRDLKSLVRRFLIDYSIVAPINTVCALFISYVLHVGNGIWPCWVFSMCIGTTAMLLMDGTRLVIWGENRPSGPKLIGIVIFAVPIAYFLGSTIAALLLGLPGKSVLTDEIDHTTGMLTFTLLVCLLVCWILWMRTELSIIRTQAETEKARSAAVEKQAMQAQLQLLQAQIEPHMLFNTLANLQGLIAIEPARAQYMLDQLIHYLRASLSSSRADKTTLRHEFELMRAYLELMSVRMGARLSYALHLPENLSQLTIPPMLLQPLVENAIKHGLESKIDGGHIDVLAEQQGDALILRITDTGLGLEAGLGTSRPMEFTAPGGVGLANVRERLLALYGELAAFKLTPNTPSGAIAQLSLPLLP